MSAESRVRRPVTLLDHLVGSLEQATRDQPGEVSPPAALLWTDADGQWAPLLPLLQEHIPQLLVFGQYAPVRRTGPAIWLKCAIARTLDAQPVPEGVVPIVYLPGVSRQLLRAGEECPSALQPLVELQYRGTVWTQRNGKDWTVEAFLVADNGLGLDVAEDATTRQSMLGCLAVLALTPIGSLQGRTLDASDFNRLLVGDHLRDMLQWMNEPSTMRAAWNGERWRAFRSRWKDEFKFDPDSEGELVAGERLGLRRDEVWRELWERFCEAPQLYPGIPGLLRRAKPVGSLLFDRDAWPDENEEAENQLRERLARLADVPAAEARRQIGELASEHGPRREWVWAKLGLAPLAKTMEPISELAEVCALSVGGESPAEMARLQAERGYRADAAALKALTVVSTAKDVRAVHAVIRSVYLPWLQNSAEHLQKLLAAHPFKRDDLPRATEAESGECILFADGLRFDLAQRLVARLEERRLKVAQKPRWSALPTVTATAKPAVSPIAGKLEGRKVPEDFVPLVREKAQPLTTDRFRSLLAADGYDVLAADDFGMPPRPDAKGWVECGQIDSRGHDLQASVANLIEAEIDRLAERTVELLEAGWRSIRIVTDHGWLLMPGGLPKTDLPDYLVASRWARCAAIKGDSQVDVPRAPWHWNEAEEFATAPGISCFTSGNEYAHGGLSLQECLVTDLRVTRGSGDDRQAVRIVEVLWAGLRCRVSVETTATALSVDLRTKPNARSTSVVSQAKPLDADGRASMVVENEDFAGSAVVAVVLDVEGNLVARFPTTIGGET